MAGENSAFKTQELWLARIVPFKARNPTPYCDVIIRKHNGNFFHYQSIKED